MPPIKNLPAPTTKRMMPDLSVLAKLEKGQCEFFPGVAVTQVSNWLAPIKSYSGRQFTTKTMEHKCQIGVMVWFID